MPQTITQEPIELFAKWYKEAEDSNYFKDPNAMWLATADADGKPSLRVVLLKGFDDRGFCFYTNLTSRKGHELADNPHAALNFYWDKLKKQVRIEGKAERVSEKEADDYYASRRRGSQIGAWASKQSLPMEKEGDLPERVKQITEQFEAGTIPRPPFWSGFRVIPERIEFWTEGEFRLHTRIRYFKDSSGAWDTERLYP